MNLKIDHRLGIQNVDFFNAFSLNIKHDSIASTFGFNFYFDPKNKSHAEIACVSHFHEAIVEHNGQTLITGYILTQSFSDSSKKELAKFAGYSKPGVLEDCEIPPSLYPLQTDGLTISQIASKLIAPFSLEIEIDTSVESEMNRVIKTTTAKETQKIKDYLTELCVQRNIIMSHTSDGKLLFTRAKTENTPIFHFEDTALGTHMSLVFSGQEMHSHITVMKQADSEGGNAGELTIQNPYVPIVYRPTVITQNSGDENTLVEFARNVLAQELKNIVLTITMDRWEIDGQIILPNNTITVTNPELFLYKETLWYIESVSYTGDEDKEIAVLTCVLPEVYNNKTPKNIFVDPHQNYPRIS
jgi:prophage tail gpP-like protein